MKLITFQHPIILEGIKNKGIYQCEFISKYHSDTPKCYDRLAKDLNKKTNSGCKNPIFAWHTVLPGEKIDISQINRMGEMVPITDGFIGLEIEVPDNLVLLQGFYNFSDVKYNELPDIDKMFGEIEWDPCDFVYEFNIEDDEVQAVIPYIKKEWINNVYMVTQNGDWEWTYTTHDWNF